jgi:predicted alpha/beta superfamily hydrolase
MNEGFRRVFLVIVGAILLITVAIAQQVPESASPSLPKVTILGSEVRNIKSANTGRDYDLYIHLPSDYGKEKSKKYPVVYILDGQWDFKLMDSVLGGLAYDKFVPPMVLVGITYSGSDPDYDSLRAMDYTPVAGRPKGSGDAEKFYAFVKDKVIPFAEQNYPADPKRRVLMGSSFGGLFTLYAMFKDPALFSRYMAASPAVSYGDDFAFKQEAEYAKSHKDLPVRLYMGVGSDEGLTKPVEKMMKVIDSRHYQGLVREFKVFEPERHASNKPELYNRGLRFLFQK